MALVVNFDIHSNFWNTNPMLKIPEVFNIVYTSDKSEDREDSSKLMWAVAIYCDNSPENKFRDLSEPERKDLIAKDFLRNPKFKWKSVEHLIKEYERICLTPAKRQLKLWDTFMDEKTEYLKGLKFKDNSEEIEKLLLSNIKLFEGLDKIKQSIDKEGDSGSVRGGATESASERGDI